MTKVNIDQVGSEVAELIRTLRREESQVGLTRALTQPKLKLVWDALKDGQVVNLARPKKNGRSTSASQRVTAR